MFGRSAAGTVRRFQSRGLGPIRRPSRGFLLVSRSKMQTNLAMIAEAYINGEQAGGGWERMPPPGLQELQAKG